MMPKKEKEENILITIIIDIVIPSIILFKFSKTIYLGPIFALILALSFPIFHGLFSFLVYKKKNIITILGFIGVFLTGTVGLLKLSPQWIAVKEGLVPLLIGILVLFS